MNRAEEEGKKRKREIQIISRRQLQVLYIPPNYITWNSVCGIICIKIASLSVNC